MENSDSAEKTKEESGINFDQSMIGPSGRPVRESYFPDENRERGEYLEQIAQLVGSLSHEEAEELLSLRQQRIRTIGAYCVDALYSQAQEDKKLDSTQKLKRGLLARKITGGCDPEAPYPTLKLNKKTRKMILDAGGSIWPPFIHTAIYIALEGEAALVDEVGDGE